MRWVGDEGAVSSAMLGLGGPEVSVWMSISATKRGLSAFPHNVVCLVRAMLTILSTQVSCCWPQLFPLTTLRNQKSDHLTEWSPM